MARREETEEKVKCEPVLTPGSILTEESRKGKETAGWEGTTFGYIK